MERSEKFPPNCPPRQANEASGEVYRLVDSDPPVDKDFLSLYELYPNKRGEDPDTECQRSGLSVHTEKSSASKLIKRIPKFKNKKIAVGQLTPDLGLILNTPSRKNDSHHTWWVPAGKKPSMVFQVVDISK
jgi:hypothetical protein